MSSHCARTGQFISRGWLVKAAELYALCLDLSDNGREDIEAGFAWLGHRIGTGQKAVARHMAGFKRLGLVEYETKSGTLTAITITERGRA